MLNLSEHNKLQSKLSDKLVWFGMVAPGVILNKNGSLQRTCELLGHDLETSSAADVEAACNRLNHIFLQLGTGWCLYFDVIRQETVSYPKSSFPNEISSLIDIERREVFSEENSSLESRYYLTFVFMPKSDSDSLVKNKFIEGKSKKIKREDDVEEFVNVTNSFINSFSYSFSKIEPLSDEKTLEYLHGLISNKGHKVKLQIPPLYLDYLLSDTPLLGGLVPKLGDKYFKVLTIRFLPGESVPGLLDSLNGLNLDFRWTSRWIALDKDDAREQINKKMRAWMSKRISFAKLIGKMMNLSADVESDNSEAAVNQDDSGHALYEVDNNISGFGYYTATIVVYDEDVDVCDKKISAIASYINDKGFTCKIETINSKDAWLGSLPGHVHANIRAPIISTQNLSHFVSISSAWSGNKSNDHFKKIIGDDSPLIVAQAQGNTPFRLNLHQGDVGHSLILGPTGGGKSTLLNLLALQFQRYKGAQVFFFDKGFSAKVATYAVGGDYFQFERGDSNISMQPLKDIHLENEIDWAEEWVVSLIVSQGVDVNIEQRKEVRQALKTLSSRDQRFRTLSNFRILIQEKDRKMSLALDKFVSDGPYGYLLDGASESLDFSSWAVFELEKLMDGSSEVIEPTITCLFHKIEKKFTGEPTILILDEAWTYLKNEVFTSKISKWLRELRKNQVSVVFATQSLSDAIDTPLMSVLLESCQTKIFLPNPEANNGQITELYKKIGLNDGQINIVAKSTPKKHYLYYSSAGVRLFDLALGDVAKCICCSAGKKDSKVAQRIYNDAGKEFFAKRWLSHKGLDWASDLLKGESNAA